MTTTTQPLSLLMPDDPATWSLKEVAQVMRHLGFTTPPVNDAEADAIRTGWANFYAIPSRDQAVEAQVMKRVVYSASLPDQAKAILDNDLLDAAEAVRLAERSRKAQVISQWVMGYMEAPTAAAAGISRTTLRAWVGK